MSRSPSTETAVLCKKMILNTKDTLYRPRLTPLLSLLLSWLNNITAFVKKAQQYLHFPRILKKNTLCVKVVVAAFCSVIEFILTYSSQYTSDTQASQQLIRKDYKGSSAQQRAALSSHSMTLRTPANSRGQNNIAKDTSHPSHHQSDFLHSRRGYSSIKTNKLFFPLINRDHTTHLSVQYISYLSWSLVYIVNGIVCD